jgi:hypothetical protein
MEKAVKAESELGLPFMAPALMYTHLNPFMAPCPCVYTFQMIFLRGI